MTRLRSRVGLSVIGGLILAAVALPLMLLSSGPRVMTCGYAGPTVSGFREFDREVGGGVRCAGVFDDAADTWAQWDDPWFVTNRDPNTNWRGFARAGNQMLVTVNLFPTDVDGTTWRASGAAGDYAIYATRLARNLIAAGMGNAIIRLGHEANGTWYADSIGTTAAEFAEWREFWRRTVLAMRSVRGARFDFDWCVNAGFRAIPFADYYPGNDVVDSIGVDVYDAGVPRAGSDRWAYSYGRPGGVAAISRFASEHRKPLMVPEWGLDTADGGGVGADARWVRSFVAFLGHRHVAMESYFFAHDSRSALVSNPMSLGILRRAIRR